jgi:plastocyanin
MHRRDLVSIAVLALAALTFGVGCPEEEKKVSTSQGASPSKTGTGANANTGAKPTGAAPTTAAPAGGGATAAMGTATIKGVVNFTGKAPEMKVPAKRKDAEFCKGKEVKYNAILAEGGKLQDVLVRLENGAVKGKFDAPKEPAVIDQVDCMYTPRIQGVVAGQEVSIKNSDGTLHNVHTYRGAESWFNQAQPKGAEPIKKELEDTSVIKLTCDVHPWMRGFIVVSDHPFFATTKADGAFTIEKVPAGKYKLEAWHTRYGLKTAEVTVEDGKTVEATFTYDGTEAEPSENKDELKDLF